MGGLLYLGLVRKAPLKPSDQLTTSIILLLVLIVAYGGGVAFRYATQRIQREKESGQQRLQELQVSLARELHDSVAQTLSSAAMRANIAMSDPGMSPLTRDHLERIADECRSSAHDLRLLLSSLREDQGRPVATGPLADVDSLRQAVDEQANRLRDEGFHVTTDVNIDKLSAARCQTLAAIVIEAANNVVKHAKPRSRCSITMVADGDEVLAEFTNVRKNTKGVHQGFGLTGIQERLTILDGSCSVTRAGGQWTLQARLPLGVEGSGNSAPEGSMSPLADPPAAEHEGTTKPVGYRL
ncbi:MAG: histidine kinase [Propionibacteriaceae bacterium]|nr:histidine kinase [Propionibacteriaceae bacterium]